MKFLKSAWLALFVLASLAFLFNYFHQQSDKFTAPLQFSAPYLVLALALQIVFWINAAWCWSKIISLTTSVQLPLLVSVSHLALTTLGKYFPGKVWGMAARATLMKQQGIRVNSTLLATFHEQIIFLHAAVLLSCILVAVLVRTEWAWAVGALGILSIPAVMLSQDFMVRLFNFLAPKLWFKGQFESWRSIPRKSYLVLLLAFLGVWLLSGLAFAAIYFTFFRGDLDARLVSAMLLANAVGNTLGFLALFAPGGIGIREAVASGILAGFIPLNDAIMLSLLFRLWMTLSELLGALTLLWPGIRSFKA
ncbi:MAG TPA: lysylphosphatidylglycerol synthase domain-containing protein [Burkholderiales bacterium]|nr:lysylphosphatidylglycerol synthase domain-containing protein [Burkholderiales bacterium]